MTTKKHFPKTPIVGFLSLLLLAAAGIAFYFGAQSFLRSSIEKAVSEALNVNVTIAGLSIDKKNKNITVSGIHIGNPAGYSEKGAVDLKTVSLSAESLSPELLIFKDVTIVGTGINLEVRETGTNITDIQRGIGRGKNPPDQNKPVKMIVRSMSISDTQLALAPSGPGERKTPILLPDIHLSGLGEKEGGLSAQALSSTIMASLARETIAASIQAGFLSGLSDEAMKEIGIDFTDRLMNDIRGAADQTGAGIKSLGSKVKRFFDENL